MDREDHPMNEPSAVKHPIDVESPMIVSTPGTCGGKPRVEGHRIRVQDIVIWHENMGMTIDEIISSYPGMNPEKIDAALRYYRAHREEIERDLEEEERLADQLESGPNIEIIRLSGPVDARTNPNSSG
jgi:uncharacterized protein (DUF433 family)